MKSLEPLGLLALRLVLGLIFLAHGFPKLAHPTEAMHEFFVAHGLPAYFVSVAGVLECFGSVLLFVGLFTRPAALLLTIEMSVAIWKVHSVHGIMSVKDYEFPLALAAGCFVCVGHRRRRTDFRGSSAPRRERQHTPDFEEQQRVSCPQRRQTRAGALGTTTTGVEGASGRAIHRSRYSNRPGPPRKIASNQTMRTIVGSRSKYSARPAQTPPSFLSRLERIRRFGGAASV